MDATLTDEEREAIAYAAKIVRLSGKKVDRMRSDVMAALLARFE
jgi:DNA-directed RNA polymerase subunit F